MIEEDSLPHTHITMSKLEKIQTPATDVIAEMLRTIGFTVSEDDDFHQRMEEWLGLKDDEDYDGDTVEDMEVSNDVYRLAASLIVTVYQRPASLVQQSTELEASFLPPEKVSLRILEPIRVTEWIRHWMDVMPLRNTNEEQSSSEDNVRLTSRLLQHCEDPIQFVEAVFYHVQEFPYIQSQIHSYTSSIQSKSRGPSGQPIDPTTRLEQYQQAQNASTKLEGEWQDHVGRIEVIIASIYRLGNIEIRKACRKGMGHVWSRYVHSSARSALRQENTSASGIPMTLRILQRILQGASFATDSMIDSYLNLLRHHLLPLHQPSALVLWRDQTSILDVYHKPLVTCIATILQKSPSRVWEDTLSALVHRDIFPLAGQSNKQVLLLHELDTYMKLPKPSESTRRTVPMDVLKTVARCMSSENSQVAERALQCFQSDDWMSHVKADYHAICEILLPSLVRTEPSWNPTVRKMTFNVLERLQALDQDMFKSVCNQVFTSSTNVRSIVSTLPPSASLESPSMPRSSKNHINTGGPPKLSRPPSGGRNMMPPPVARRTPAHPTPGRPIGRGVAPWSKASGQPPPVTITGVAPWANQEQMASAKRSRPPELGMSVISEAQTTPAFGFERVSNYMQSIKPKEEVIGSSKWSIAQMAETPTLLKDLNFYDLVFGHDLGHGAFGVVRYARLIDKSKTRSHWAEYAVKVISTEKIREMGYEASIRREIAVMRVLSHPGIARLISDFRFRDGAYLVLEYASKGDLFTLLRKQGSLDIPSTKFVMGEVLAALASIHEMSFVYGDLKPENILVTEIGHIKLTDFGGCRPISDKAKALIRETSQNIADMRDGNWKSKKDEEAPGWGEEAAIDSEPQKQEMLDEEIEDELRVEGTTAYLPPEVVMGGFPTTAADMWAFACVMYQCLTGKPPMLEADDSSTRNRIVSFDGKQEDSLFDNEMDDDEARSLILSLLHRTSSLRPNAQQVADHAFFSNVSVWKLHSQDPHPLEAGSAAAPAEDSRWSRRQFSSIWAPQPETYNIGGDILAPPSSTTGDALSGPIEEGGEASSFFSVLATRQRESIQEGRAPLPK